MCQAGSSIQRPSDRPCRPMAFNLKKHAFFMHQDKYDTLDQQDR